ncbi:vascular endothelial growth factor A-A-like [Palaemon carinicauda]|uniref:vascular endothelial growth factor A-A-like n=1 Tax=Palaemon carinicauda TaxID=392227 RepID=UPI0035B5EEF3
MRVLWIYGLLLCSVIVHQGQSEKCWNTRDLEMAKKKNYMEVDCMEGPRDTLITLRPPRGYDKVYPSVTIAKRCTNLMCVRMDQECMPTANTTRLIRVEAFNSNMGMRKHCFDLEVEDHVSCGCRCDKTQEQCGKNKVFNKNTCSCDCLPERENACRKRMVQMPNTVMWDPSSCSCPCNNWQECGSGELWADEKCRCVPDMTNEIFKK